MDRAGRTLDPPQLPTAEELESALRQHVLDVWFPRSLDQQFECLKTLTAAIELAPENVKYRTHLAAQWNYVRSNFIDLRHGGTYAEALDGLPRWRSWLGRTLAPAKISAKGYVWKDASHDGRAILYCLAQARATAGSHEAGNDRRESSQPLARCA